jgi:hypothetical protein
MTSTFAILRSILARPELRARLADVWGVLMLVLMLIGLCFLDGGIG